jgi:hypothetical protein
MSVPVISGTRRSMRSVAFENENRVWLFGADVLARLGLPSSRSGPNAAFAAVPDEKKRVLTRAELGLPRTSLRDLGNPVVLVTLDAERYL